MDMYPLLLGEISAHVFIKWLAMVVSLIACIDVCGVVDEKKKTPIVTLTVIAMTNVIAGLWFRQWLSWLCRWPRRWLCRFMWLVSVLMTVHFDTEVLWLLTLYRNDILVTVWLWLCDCDCERERVTVTVWVALPRGMWLLLWLWLCIYIRLWHCVMCLSPTTYDVDISHCAFDFALMANLSSFLRWTMFQMDRGLWPNRCCVRIQLNNWSLRWKKMPRQVHCIWATPPSRKSWAVM